MTAGPKLFMKAKLPDEDSASKNRRTLFLTETNTLKCVFYFRSRKKYNFHTIHSPNMAKGSRSPLENWEHNAAFGSFLLPQCGGGQQSAATSRPHPQIHAHGLFIHEKESGVRSLIRVVLTQVS